MLSKRKRNMVFKYKKDSGPWFIHRYWKAFQKKKVYLWIHRQEWMHTMKSLVQARTTNVLIILCKLSKKVMSVYGFCSQTNSFKSNSFYLQTMYPWIFYLISLSLICICKISLIIFSQDICKIMSINCWVQGLTHNSHWIIEGFYYYESDK